jgi:hypothetical protein
MAMFGCVDVLLNVDGGETRSWNEKAQPIVVTEESFYWWIWTVGCSKGHE